MRMTVERYNALLVQAYDNLRILSESVYYADMLKFGEHIETIGPQIMPDEWYRRKIALKQDMEVIELFDKFHQEASKLFKKYNPKH